MLAMPDPLTLRWNGLSKNYARVMLMGSLEQFGTVE